jgi:hypothetical protein
MEKKLLFYWLLLMVQELKRQLSSKLNHPPIAMILLANADREYRDSRFDTNKFIQLSELQYIDLL